MKVADRRAVGCSLLRRLCLSLPVYYVTVVVSDSSTRIRLLGRGLEVAN